MFVLINLVHSGLIKLVRAQRIYAEANRSGPIVLVWAELCSFRTNRVRSEPARFAQNQSGLFSISRIRSDSVGVVRAQPGPFETNRVCLVVVVVVEFIHVIHCYKKCQKK